MRYSQNSNQHDNQPDVNTRRHDFQILQSIRFLLDGKVMSRLDELDARLNRVEENVNNRLDDIRENLNDIKGRLQRP